VVRECRYLKEHYSYSSSVSTEKMKLVYMLVKVSAAA
jgi:hypothetical protein